MKGDTLRFFVDSAAQYCTLIFHRDRTVCIEAVMSTPHKKKQKKKQKENN